MGPRKISEYFASINTKAVATFFLNILQKCYQLPILGTFDMSGYFHQKGQYQLAETLMFVWIQKMNSIPKRLL